MGYWTGEPTSINYAKKRKDLLTAQEFKRCKASSLTVIVAAKSLSLQGNSSKKIPCPEAQNCICSLISHTIQWVSRSLCHLPTLFLRGEKVVVEQKAIGKTFDESKDKFPKCRKSIFKNLQTWKPECIKCGRRERYLFCARLWHPSKPITNAVHMSIYTYPLNIIPSDIHNLKHHMGQILKMLSHY